MSGIADGSPVADVAIAAPAARFARALARLWPEGGKLGLAVSGGIDSLAMLLLADAAISGSFEVATVDHGLRAGSAAECAMVRDVCTARAIPCTVLSVKPAGSNLQAAARAARYEALAGWARERGLSAIATAHQADDQAETFIMRLNRGSGVAGLAGVRERGLVPGSDISLVRPLLGFRRAELDRLLGGAGLTPVQDPSNMDDRFDRVRIRKALAEDRLLDRAAIVAAASHLADADKALQWASDREWAERVTATEGEIRYRPQAPRAVTLRIVERAIASLGAPPRGEGAARLLTLLEHGRGGNVAGVLARAEADEWVFRPEPPRRPNPPQL